MNVDVANSSWGYTAAFVDNFSDPAWAPMKSAIVSGVTEGRGGLGTTYVFAAGNDRQYTPNSISYDGDNTNYHSLTNSRFTTTVAASNSDGHDHDLQQARRFHPGYRARPMDRDDEPELTATATSPTMSAS